MVYVKLSIRPEYSFFSEKTGGVHHMVPIPGYQVLPILSTSLMKRGLVICKDPVPLESFGSCSSGT